MAEIDPRLEEAIDGMAELIVSTMLHDGKAVQAWGPRKGQWRREFEHYALKRCGLTEHKLRQLGEEAGLTEDPRYSLYYATLTSLNQIVLARVGIKLFHPAP